MLRDWNGDSNKLIIDILAQFGFKPKDIAIYKYESITPDSFIWELSFGEDAYYLYAEDHVPSLDHVKDSILSNRGKWNPDNEVELLPVKNRKEWEDSAPVQSATVYSPPEKPDEFMKYAAQSGFDFVFLAVVKD